MVNLLKAFRVTPDETGVLPPPETVNRRVILLSLFGCCAAMLFGYDLGFIGGVVSLPSFAHDYELEGASAAAKTALSSNIVSVFQAGAIFGPFVSSFVANSIGRKLTLIVNLVFYLLGAALMTGASGRAGVGLVYAGRVITGWGVGASTMLVPVYVAECAPAHIRGRLVGMYEVGVQFGTMVGFWIPYGVLKTQKGSPQWRIPFAIQIIIAGLALIWLTFLTETPRFVARKKGEAEAAKLLSHLRNIPDDHPYLRGELAGIMEQIEIENDQTADLGRFGVVREAFGRRNLKALYTGSGTMIFFQLAGTNAVNYYSPKIFTSLGLSATSASLFATGVYGVIRFVATLIAMVLFVDRFGRVSMIVAGGSSMAVCMWIVGALIKSSPPVPDQGMSSAQLAAIIFIYIWAVSFCFSYAGIPWIYCSEIFPIRIRSFCMAWCTAVHWSFNLLIAKTTPYAIESLHGYGLYFVFGACTTIGAVWEYFCMPETKGKTLEEIEGLFGRYVPQVNHFEQYNDKEKAAQIEDHRSGEGLA